MGEAGAAALGIGSDEMQGSGTEARPGQDGRTPSLLPSCSFFISHPANLPRLGPPPP